MLGDSVRRHGRGRLLAPLCGVALLLMSCAPTSTSTNSGAPGGSGQPANTNAAPRAAKIIHIGMQLQEEPMGRGASTGIINITGPGTTGGSGATEHRLIFHAGLTILDDHSVLQPLLAVQAPSLSDGSWKVAGDGSMELTWKLKPNLFWHDGVPLKADDFVFGPTVARDKDFVAAPPAIGTRQLTEVLAPDDLTLVVRFPTPYVNANLGD